MRQEHVPLQTTALPWTPCELGDPSKKFVPVTVIVMVGAPAVTEPGLIELIDGEDGPP